MALLLTSALTLAHAEAIENLRTSLWGGPSLGTAETGEAPAVLAQPVAGMEAGETGALPSEDARVLNSFTGGEWDEIFARRANYSGISGTTKELFSDYNTRYIVNGTMNFAVNPPRFTADTGKVFIVNSYPDWLRKIGNKKVCVEGFARQQDDTSELIISKVLPSAQLASVTPNQGMLEIQKTANIISSTGGKYVLGNVAWNLKHNSNGALARDQYGYFSTEWRNGVTVKPDLLENAYFVKMVADTEPRYGSHGLLIFTFKPGGVVAADGKPARGLAVSLDAYYKDRTNMNYSPVDGLAGKYMVYYSVSTMERYLEFKIRDGNNALYFYPLIVSAQQRRKLLDNALRKATENKLGEMYSLLYNSCTNAAISMINSVLEQSRKISAGWLPEIVYRASVTFPDTAAAVLLKKGVTQQPLPAVNQSNFIKFLARN